MVPSKKLRNLSSELAGLLACWLAGLLACWLAGWGAGGVVGFVGDGVVWGCGVGAGCLGLSGEISGAIVSFGVYVRTLIV